MCLSGQNILVSGATQSGKTTMLNALLSQARSNDRIVTVEETFELDITARDAVAMQVPASREPERSPCAASLRRHCV